MKGLCPYCGELPKQHTKDFRYQEPNPTTVCAILTLKGESQSASIKETVEDNTSNLEN